MVLPDKQEDNRDQANDQPAGNQGKTDTDRSKKPSRRLRFILYVGISMFLYYLFFLVRVRPRVFSDYVTWIIVSLGFGCMWMLGEFLGIKLFGRDEGKDSEK